MKPSLKKQEALQPNGRLISVQEAATMLGLSAACIRAWIYARKLGHVKLGRSVRVPLEEVQRLIDQGTIPAKEPRNGRS